MGKIQETKESNDSLKLKNSQLKGRLEMKDKVKVKEADDRVKAIAKQNERYGRSLLDAKTKFR